MQSQDRQINLNKLALFGTILILASDFIAFWVAYQELCDIVILNETQCSEESSASIVFPSETQLIDW